MKRFFRYFYSAQQKMLEARYRRQPSCGTVLMFHNVYKGTDCGDAEQEIAVSEEHFSALVERLIKTKRFVALKQYEDILNMTADDVLITFDDIFQSAFLNAIPVLQKYEIPYVVFIATGLVGKPGFISEENLMKLREDPLCTIGAHSVSHGFSRFAPKTAREEAEKSLAKLGSTLFAFPYGSVFACSNRNQRDLEGLGNCSCAFSTINTDLTEENRKNRWFLPRRNVNDAVCKKWLSVKECF